MAGAGRCASVDEKQELNNPRELDVILETMFVIFVFADKYDPSTESEAGHGSHAVVEIVLSFILKSKSSL